MPRPPWHHRHRTSSRATGWRRRLGRITDRLATESGPGLAGITDGTSARLTDQYETDRPPKSALNSLQKMDVPDWLFSRDPARGGTVFHQICAVRRIYFTDTSRLSRHRLWAGSPLTPDPHQAQPGIHDHSRIRRHRHRTPLRGADDQRHPAISLHNVRHRRPAGPRRLPGSFPRGAGPVV
jgi:hypothetical protein